MLEKPSMLSLPFEVAAYHPGILTPLTVRLFGRMPIPKRHIESYFDLYQPELTAMHSLLAAMRADITKANSDVCGFNVGTNNGSEAGQTILHCHLHLIPRRKGDMDDPRGGVRGVIPDKRVY
jgi:diadenosine tetraphosphate (Ap4A) HIT family hydrolase